MQDFLLLISVAAFMVFGFFIADNIMSAEQMVSQNHLFSSHYLYNQVTESSKVK